MGKRNLIKVTLLEDYAGKAKGVSFAISHPIAARMIKQGIAERFIEGNEVPKTAKKKVVKTKTEKVSKPKTNKK